MKNLSIDVILVLAHVLVTINDLNDKRVRLGSSAIDAVGYD